MPDTVVIYRGGASESQEMPLMERLSQLVKSWT